ncbi:hypothetical protein BDZ91DRAFT_735973 [Kalaharituber pfeilii]|nr:hypothetical protein BDZ91DRAFT_735973 [Kalaharituber pfeilii]
MVAWDSSLALFSYWSSSLQPFTISASLAPNDSFLFSWRTKVKSFPVCDCRGLSFLRPRAVLASSFLRLSLIDADLQQPCSLQLN